VQSQKVGSSESASQDCRLPAAVAVAGIVLLVAGCSASHRPVLYPNAHYEVVGETAAEQAMADCMQRARAFGTRSGRAESVARDTVGGAAIGGASAAAWGAVRDGDVGNRAAAGAAAGGAAGLVRGMLRATEPSATHKRFVQRCLRERGYDVIGWE
jgi:hypothetical protein